MVQISTASARATTDAPRSPSPYGFDLIEDCKACPVRHGYLFCDLPAQALDELNRIKSVAAYPKGAMLFMEGQAPRGVFILCHGRAKLSTSSAEGKTMILRLAEPGEVLGLSAVVSNTPYETTCEMLEPVQANFISRDNLLRFLQKHGDVALRVAQELSRNYHSAYTEIRSLALSSSASEKLAKLLLQWSADAGSEAREVQMKMTLTHEEIAQLIGTSRETVTRALSDMRRKKLIMTRGATLIIPNRKALERLAHE
jgi:CRP/FNR family cyclic AMP-dependent transcriptional regulator